MDRIEVKRYRSPIGELMVGSYQGRLCLCDWSANRRRHATDCRLQRIVGAVYAESSSETVERTISELEEYFAGLRRSFDIDVMLCGTALQQLVWPSLMSIPYGTVISYGGLARRIGAPTAVRAVANAVASNPLSIIVPCHRVVGSDNRLTGYAGGIEAKQALLSIEATPALSLLTL